MFSFLKRHVDHQPAWDELPAEMHEPFLRDCENLSAYYFWKEPRITYDFQENGSDNDEAVMSFPLVNVESNLGIKSSAARLSPMKRNSIKGTTA